MGKKKKKESYQATSVVMLFLAVILFYPPFLRGLFFPKELFITHFVTALAVMACIWLDAEDRPLPVLRTVMDYAAFGLLAVYFVSIFFAAVPFEALRETLKLANFLLIYLLVSYYSYKKENADLIVKSLYLSGLGVAFVGSLAAMGILDLPGLIKGGRINSTIQYPNSLAVYLLAVLCLGLLVYSNQKGKGWQMAVSVGNYVVFLTFLGTQSRGALLILPIMVVLLLAGPVKEMRKTLVFQLVANIAVGAGVYAAAFGNATSSTAWKVSGFLAGIIITLILNYLPRLAGKTVGKIDGKIHWLAGGVAVVILITLFAVAPVRQEIEPAFKRFARISLSERNVVERGVFYKDALKVVRDHPVIGVGGGGWAGVYKQYRSYAYSSRAVHNHFLQTAVETGLIGLTIFIFLITTFLIQVIKYVKNKDSKDRITVWILATAAVVILMHSLIDFNLSLGAVSILLWSIFGCVRAYVLKTVTKKDLNLTTSNRFVKKVLAAFVIVYALVSGGLLVSVSYGDAAFAAYQSGDKFGAIQELERAAAWNPLNGQYKIMLAELQLSTVKQGRDDRALKKALENADAAIDLEPNDPDKHVVRANIMLRLGKPEEGIIEYKRALALDPTSQERYDDLARLYYKVGQYYEAVEKPKEAVKYYELVREVPKMIAIQKEKMPYINQMPWVTRQYNLTESQIIKENLENARIKLQVMR